MSITLKKLVKDTTAHFVCYRDGDLWYRVVVPADDSKDYTFNFPVPISDTGTGIFQSEMPAITLMRWIRKQLDVRPEE